MATEARLERILAMVPWIVAHDGPTVEETCTRFGCTAPELMRDIQLLYLCGLYPYTPDLLIEASVVDGRVYIEYAEYFSRPLRLTPAEGLGLVAAASALLSTPGTDVTGPLARGLAKLAAALGGDDSSLGEAVDVALGADDTALLNLLREASPQRQQVAIRYYSFGRDDVEDRIIEPVNVFRAMGEWYVQAWCHRAADERTFRVDRIEHADVLATPPTGPHVQPTSGLFVRAAETGVVELALNDAAAWVADRYPIDGSRTLPDGRLAVRLQVSEWAWLDRLVLALGPNAEILASPAGWNGRSAAAERVLDRYRANPRGD